jgi:hypothetical protein
MITTKMIGIITITIVVSIILPLKINTAIAPSETISVHIETPLLRLDSTPVKVMLFCSSNPDAYCDWKKKNIPSSGGTVGFNVADGYLIDGERFKVCVQNMKNDRINCKWSRNEYGSYLEDVYIQAP